MDSTLTVFFNTRTNIASELDEYMSAMWGTRLGWVRLLKALQHQGWRHATNSMIEDIEIIHGAREQSKEVYGRIKGWGGMSMAHLIGALRLANNHAFADRLSAVAGGAVPAIAPLECNQRMSEFINKHPTIFEDLVIIWMANAWGGCPGWVALARALATTAGLPLNEAWVARVEAIADTGRNRAAEAYNRIDAMAITVAQLVAALRKANNYNLAEDIERAVQSAQPIVRPM